MTALFNAVWGHTSYQTIYFIFFYNILVISVVLSQYNNMLLMQYYRNMHLYCFWAAAPVGDEVL